MNFSDMALYCVSLSPQKSWKDKVWCSGLVKEVLRYTKQQQIKAFIINNNITPSMIIDQDLFTQIYDCHIES